MKRCCGCHQWFPDLPSHTGKCPAIRYALDPVWVPADPDPANESQRQRVLKRYQPDRSAINRANANKRKKKATRRGGYWIHGKQAQKKKRS